MPAILIPRDRFIERSQSFVMRKVYVPTMASRVLVDHWLVFPEVPFIEVDAILCTNLSQLNDARAEFPNSHQAVSKNLAVGCWIKCNSATATKYVCITTRVDAVQDVPLLCDADDPNLVEHAGDVFMHPWAGSFPTVL